MDSNAAAARLRKTFHYPTDNDNSDDDNLPEALDEEEQTHLIQNLTTKNASSNKLYTRLFLLLSLACLPLYLPSLFTNRASTTLPALLALTSLGCSAYTLLSLPAGVTGIREVDDWVRQGSAKATSDSKGKAPARNLLPQLGQRVDRGPLELYIPYLNIALACLVAVGGWIIKGGSGLSSGEAWSRLGLLPGVVYVVVLVGKMVMGGVDPESELEGLKYGYKGA